MMRDALLTALASSGWHRQPLDLATRYLFKLGLPPLARAGDEQQD